MADNELIAFRKRWKEELELKKEHQQLVRVPPLSRDVSAQSAQKESKNRYFVDSEQYSSKALSPLKPEESDKGHVGGEVEQPEDQPEYVSIARGLLDGRTSPLLDRIQKEKTRRKRQYNSINTACNTILQQDYPLEKVTKNEKLVDQFIQDLVWN